MSKHINSSVKNNIIENVSKDELSTERRLKLIDILTSSIDSDRMILINALASFSDINTIMSYLDDCGFSFEVRNIEDIEAVIDNHLMVDEDEEDEYDFMDDNCCENWEAFDEVHDHIDADANRIMKAIEEYSKKAAKKCAKEIKKSIPEMVDMRFAIVSASFEEQLLKVAERLENRLHNETVYLEHVIHTLSNTSTGTNSNWPFPITPCPLGTINEVTSVSDSNYPTATLKDE